MYINKVVLNENWTTVLTSN